MTLDGASRGRERLRRLGLTGLATLATRSLTVLAGLVTIPVTARHLGPERFGLWLLLGTFLTWVSLADLGISNTLTTELARADGREDRETPRTLVASAFFPVLLVAAAILALVVAVFPFVPWARLVNAGGPAAADVGSAVAATAVLFVARLPAGFAARIHGAYQEGYRYQVFSGVASGLSIVALLAAISAGASLAALLLAFHGTALLGDVAAGVETFLVRRPWLAPRLRNLDWRVARRLMADGFVFWIAQIAAILLLETDLILVARLFGAAAVGEYGVAQRVFGLVPLVQMAFASSLWPAYAEALARNDVAWVHRIFGRSLAAGAAWGVLASAGLVLFGGLAVRILLGAPSPPGTGLLLAMATVAVTTTVGQSFAMLLNGLGDIRIQAWLGLASGVVNIVASVSLAGVVGVPGIALGTTVAILTSLAVSARFLAGRLRSLRPAQGAPGGRTP